MKLFRGIVEIDSWLIRNLEKIANIRILKWKEDTQHKDDLNGSKIIHCAPKT